MPTYGEKWRANSSACDSGHVPRSYQTPLLRLDSTGEISSVDHSSQSNRTPTGCTPSTEMNGNIVNMKNWVTNRVLGCNGLKSNLTGNKSNISATDLNANILGGISDPLPDSTVNTMNLRHPMPGFIQPQCGVSGWNYCGQGFGRVNAGAFAVFPCHQFSNSFNAVHSIFGNPGKMDMFSNSEMVKSSRGWIQEDQQWRHRYYDRSYRGHSPKHHKQEHVRREKRLSPSEHVPSKCSDKRSQQEKSSAQTKSSDFCTGKELEHKQQHPKSKSVGVNSKIESASVKCSIQVKPDDSVPSLAANQVIPDAEKNGAHELNVPKVSLHTQKYECEENRKNASNGICDTMLNQMFTVNILNAHEQTMEDTKSEKPCSGGIDPDKQESSFQVLLTRENRKKGRPSSSKQRRRKQQKAKSGSGPDSTDDSKIDDSSMDVTMVTQDDTKVNGCSATVSFILGLSQSPTAPTISNGSSASHSFLVSFSDDESCEENDSDWNTDFNIEGDFAQCDLFNFLPNNNCMSSTSPVNFQVHISPVQNGPDIQDKTIEDINTSWNIQISLKEDACKKKKRPSKKVHFPDDRDLSVVHPMIAWSYAYKAARKGHWENFVRDRDRFKRRVKDLESVLVPILDDNHRQAIYMNRFNDIEN